MVEEGPRKPAQELEDVSLVEGDATKVTKVGAGLDSDLKDKIVGFLKQNLDIFAWTHEDMLGIDNKVRCLSHQKAHPAKTTSFCS